MIKVYQTKFNDEGNCFAACVASVLKCNIEDLPHLGVDEDWEEYEQRLNDYLRENYSTVLTHVSYDDWRDFINLYLRDSYCIVSGQSNRGYEHAVIYKNELLVHDPHPSNSGIEEIKSAYVFFRLHIN
ncbi:hypothetical protein H8S95_01810 [Pontibacter sp. KCTC 32443]|uniref:hypothetical protein n=1 Tax=Pontibacter TaxID=323449 RepID=UPI00164E6C2A|nr:MULTISPECIES: hypothetical protein [Pontibacter]MBC5772785.1 hypothetical protein [Pontibacter sp. KCTC 32443]